jgi:hypothetical protein
MMSKLDNDLMAAELDALLSKKIAGHPLPQVQTVIEPMSSLAPALLKNSLNNRLQRMIDQKQQD